MQQLFKKRNILILLLITALVLQMAIPATAFAASKKKVKSVSFTNVGTYLTLKKGEKKQLKVAARPKNAKNKKVKYKSSRWSVVSVSSRGVLKAKRKGTAYITVTARDGSGKKDRVKVTVGTKVSSVKYTNITSTYVMKKGSKKTLKVAVSPSTASNKKISWSSSRSSVVSVSSKGVMKAKKKGTAYITAKARDGSGKKVRYKIMVGTKVSKITVSGQSYVGKGGSAIKLSAGVSPGSASYKSVTWKSSNTSVARVSSAGTITGVNTGAVTITATARDGTGKKGTFRVNVVLPAKSDAIFVGHRGYSAVAPENTLAAFREALRFDFGGMECDVWQTQDIPEKDTGNIEKEARAIAADSGISKATVPYTEDRTEKNPQGSRILEQQKDEPENPGGGGEGEVPPHKLIPGLMIMHDQSLLRMCGINELITALNPDQLKEYPVIRGNNIGKYGAQEIPSFKQYLEVFKGNEAAPFIEIKSESPRSEANAISPEAAAELVEELHQANMENRTVIVQSFNMYSLLRVIEAAKDPKYGGLTLTILYLTSAESEVGDAELALYRESGIAGICINRAIASSHTIARAKAHGLKVGVWTVDDTTLAYKLANIDGVDYIISNKKVFE